ncbi:MAG TPA: tRNA pseudouridine(38-40) synthase TruA [Saprospiraceae bacterium]|nr:tRNA pseudouridine(38-40) synthase TruA [Saprospiraceae bacterium]HNM23938.1 tRNA pseudouridine(38-40) synthase TruA [Saprospiraceae bacterium]
MRFFLTLAYKGTAYAGWQRQPNAVSVQARLEEALTTLLRHPVELTGCGRTDAGVHAGYYVAHFDTADALPASFERAVNSLLPPDIAVFGAAQVADDAHARYDAVERSYEYHIALRKDPFATELAWFYPQHARLDLGAMQEVARMLTEFEDFAPFCKSDSGLDHFKCDVKSARWEWLPERHRLVFHITANRFLRGMVRLIVGACMQAGRGKLHPESVRAALQQQQALPLPLSVPPQGLFLSSVAYPFAFQGKT